MLTSLSWFIPKWMVPVRLGIYFLLLSLHGCNQNSNEKTITADYPKPDRRGRPALPFNPEHYACLYAQTPPVIDGVLEEKVWSTAPWTADFRDIEGEIRPLPYYRTRAKMLWDENNFYVAAWMEEPHLRGILKQRDTIIFKDNDFEIFLEDDGDTHNYFEIEINALGTIFDLMLVRPYRDGGPVVISWDAARMQSAVKLYGTLNDASDLDSAWTVEFAIPWEHFGGRRKVPKENDVWRVNFSRVEYDLEIKNGVYQNKTSPETGQPLPENNWVWSPQGIVNMHYPEIWGYVRFIKDDDTVGKEDVLNKLERAKWALRELYYNQKAYFSVHKNYSDNLKELGADTVSYFIDHGPPEIFSSPGKYHIRTLIQEDSTFVNIIEDGKVWYSKQ